MALDQTWLENPAAVRHIFAEVNVYDGLKLAFKWYKENLFQ